MEVNEHTSSHSASVITKFIEDNSTVIEENSKETDGAAVHSKPIDLNSQNTPPKGSTIPVKPIMAHNIENILDFTDLIDKNCDSNFTIKVDGK